MFGILESYPYLFLQIRQSTWALIEWEMMLNITVNEVWSKHELLLKCARNLSQEVNSWGFLA